MPWKPADSTMFAGYDYDADMAALHLRLKSGETWTYQGVPPEVAKAFEEAPSMGSFFHRNIRNRFRSV